MLTPREIIARAWMITLTQRSIRGWGFFGSFFEILLDVKLWTYQAYFMYEYFYGNGGSGFFDVEILLYHALPFGVFLTIVITFITLFLIELIVPSLATGALIGLSAKAHNGEKVQGGGILALYNFFPILALHEAFVLSGFSTMVTAASIAFRYSGNLGSIIVGFIVILWLLSNFFKFFINFSEEAVVIDKVNIYNACGISIKMTISNLRHMVFLIVLMLMITIRILINALVIVIFPFIILGIGLLLTYVVTPPVMYITTAIISVLLLLVTSYFFAYLHVFKQAVWTITYMELKKQKDLDRIG